LFFSPHHHREHGFRQTGQVCLVSDPQGKDSANNLATAYGVTSVINPNGSCLCGSVRIEESTWGRVKWLYSDD
jgi:hypothetical protein